MYETLDHIGNQDMRDKLGVFVFSTNDICKRIEDVIRITGEDSHNTIAQTIMDV